MVKIHKFAQMIDSYEISVHKLEDNRIKERFFHELVPGLGGSTG